MKQTFLSLILFFVYACGSPNQTYAITDVTTQQKIILKNAKDKGNVHGMRVNGSGYIQGSAEIILMLNKKAYKTELLNGNIKFTWEGDWYSDDMEIIYKPTSAKSGKLNLIYRFR